MLALIRFLFLCALAIASGVAAVSIPIAGRTPAEHVRHYVHAVVGAVEAATPSATPASVAAAPAAKARPAGKRAEERPPADSIRDEERAALDHLIGEKSR